MKKGISQRTTDSIQMESRPRRIQESNQELDQQQKQLKIETLVILKEDNTPPTQWPLGRSIDVPEYL